MKAALGPVPSPVQARASAAPGTAGELPVRPRGVAVALSAVVGGVSLLVAGAGLFAPWGTAPASVTSVHGEVVELYGSGLYRYDSVFRGAANRGSDLVTLMAGLPLLAVSTVLYRRRSLPGTLLLAGALTWFLYLYASLSLGTAYNGLFLAYVAVFGAALYALVLTLRSLDVAGLGARLGVKVRRRVAALMLASGLLTAGVWLAPLVAAALAGEPPDLLDHSTTMVTDALDLAVITPATLVAAWLLHRGRAEGFLLAVPLLVLLLFLLPMIVAQTVFQLQAGVAFTPAEIAGPITGFLVLGALALGLVVAVLRRA